MSLLSVSILSEAKSAAEGAVTVDLDASLLVQIVLFVVLLVVLKPTLFDPMMRLFEEREKRIEGTRRKAVKEDERSAKALAEYEAVLAKAREVGTAERNVLIVDAQKKENDLLSRVRTETAQVLETGRADTAKSSAGTRGQLRSDAVGLGREIASRVLGREVAS